MSSMRPVVSLAWVTSPWMRPRARSAGFSLKTQVQYITVQYSKVQYITVNYSTVQYIEVHYRAGLPSTETSLARLVSRAGYRTAAVGKVLFAN